MKPFGPSGPSLRELLTQGLSSTEHGYDQLAPKFDATPFRTPDAIVQATVAAAGDVDDALDLCCGTGAALSALLPHTRRRLCGVDFSAGMLAEARKRLGASVTGDAPRVELVRRDLFAVDFDSAFDLVTCFGAFGHVPAEAEVRFVRIVRRALRPGGRFLFVTAERPRTGSPSHLVAAGFNAAMRVRNAFVSPPFIMIYLTFMLPDAARLLRWEGFEVVHHDEVRFAPPFERLRLVEAIRSR